MQPKSEFHNITPSPLSLPISKEVTQPLPVVTPDITPLAGEQPSPLVPDLDPLKTPSKKQRTRIVASVITLLLAGAIFVIWFVGPPASSPSTPLSISKPSLGSSGQNTGTSTSSGGELHVYVTGSIKHPGVYILPAGARVYQL